MILNLFICYKPNLSILGCQNGCKCVFVTDGSCFYYKKPNNFFYCCSAFFVGIPGFEPGKAGPESAVLPLHHTPNLGVNKRASLEYECKITAFSENCQIKLTFFNHAYTRKLQSLYVCKNFVLSFMFHFSL